VDATSSSPAQYESPSRRMHGAPHIVHLDDDDDDDEYSSSAEESDDVQLEVHRRDDIGRDVQEGSGVAKKSVKFDILEETDNKSPVADASSQFVQPRRDLESSTRKMVLVRQSSVGGSLAFDMASKGDAPSKTKKRKSVGGKLWDDAPGGSKTKESSSTTDKPQAEEKQQNELDLDFYQSLLVPNTTDKVDTNTQHNKRERAIASHTMDYLKRDPGSIIAMIRKQQEQREKLFPDDKSNMGPGSWKQVWSAKWKQKMAKRNADVELYESSKFSELDFIHQFDEIMQLVVSGRIELQSQVEKDEFQSHMFQMKRFIDENLRQSRVQNQLLRGKLKRREQLLEDQRKKYHHELILLREELFRKKQDDNYAPTDYSFNDWNASNLRDIWLQEQKEGDEEISKSDLHSDVNVSDKAKTKNASNEEKMIYDTLKKQTEQVTETLEKLKRLESKRKEELDELKKKQDETDRIKKQLEEKAEEIKNLPLQRVPTSNAPGRRRGSAGRRLSATSVGSNEQPSLRKRSSNATSVFSDTEDMLNDLDTHLNARLSVNSDAIRDHLDEALQDEKMKSTMLLSEEVAEFVDNPSLEPTDTSIDVLEDEISNFQGQFKNLYQQMYHVKERIQFYQDEIKEKENQKATDEGPTGFVTLIFTDVESSTALWELSSEEMMRAIKLHNEVILRLIEETECYFVKVEGDAFMVASGDVFNGVLLALRIQEELLHAEWSEKLLSFEPTKEHRAEDGRILWRGLRVRVGIHAGEPYVEKDPVRGFSDYFGNDVNKAARIEGCAQGGQVAISNVVYEKIKDRLDEFPMPVECTFYGSVALKGIKGEESVYHIIPSALNDRPFKQQPSPKKGMPQNEEPQGMMDLQSQLKYLEDKHNSLENDRMNIQKKIRFQMKIQTLEDAMKEKDVAIIQLRKRLQLVKKKYNDADKSNDERTKRESRRQNTAIQSEIASTMEKYSQMVDEYNNMKENYDHVVNVFNSRLKREMDYFKKELNIMRGAVESKEMQRYSDHKIFEMERDRFTAIISNKEKVIKQQAHHIGSLEQRLLSMELSQTGGGGHMLVQGGKRPQSSPAGRHPSIHMSQKRFNKEMVTLEKQGSFHDVAAVLKEAIREAVEKKIANQQKEMRLSRHDGDDDSTTHSDPMRLSRDDEETTRHGGSFSAKLRSSSNLTSMHGGRSEFKRKPSAASGRSRSTKRSNSAFSIPHGRPVSRQTSNNSIISVRSRPTSRKRNKSASSSRRGNKHMAPSADVDCSDVDSRPERPLHTAFDGSTSRMSITSDYSVMSGYSRQSMSRPSTTHTLQRYLNQRGRSATPVARANVVGNLDVDGDITPADRLNTPGMRRPQSRQSPYHVVTAKSTKKFPSWDSPAEEHSTPQSGFIRSSYSRLLRTAPVKHRTGNSQISAVVTVRGRKAKNLTRAKSVPPPPLDLIEYDDVRTNPYSTNESRTVRKLLKIVARGRAQTTDPIMQNTFDPHRQFVQDSQNVLKSFYGKRYGDVQYDSNDGQNANSDTKKAATRFQSALDDDYHSKIAAMRRLITQEMEHRMKK